MIRLCFILASALAAKIESRSVRGVNAGEEGYHHPTQRRTKMGMMSGMSMRSSGGFGFYDRNWDDDEVLGREAESNWHETISTRTNSNGEGGAGTVEEWYDCRPLSEMVGEEFFLDPDITGETGVLRKYEYTPNMCRCDDGCCRLYNWLLCDTTDSLPYIQCICNENTHPIANPVPAQDIISIEDPNNTGTTPATLDSRLPGVTTPATLGSRLPDATITVNVHTHNAGGGTTNNGIVDLSNIGTNTGTVSFIADRAADDDDWEDDDDDDDDDDDWEVGRAGSVIEYYACKPPEELVGQQFFLNPDETGESGTLRKFDYYDGMCTCDSGCCRIYQWLQCDEDNYLPSMQCVCNQNTARISPSAQGSITVGGPNDTGATVTRTGDTGGSSIIPIGSGTPSNNNNGATLQIIGRPSNGGTSNSGGGGGAFVTINQGARTGGIGDGIIPLGSTGSNGATLQIIGQPTNGGTSNSGGGSFQIIGRPP